jgi:carboxymethylenebutenolidase
VPSEEGTVAGSTNVKFPTAKGEASGHLARPGKERPGVVVIQEWWGLVPHIKDVAARFAAQGYVALAPDLYHGKSSLDAAEAQHLMQGLDWARAAEEIEGAVVHLREKEGCTKVGVVGFCMGGALTMIAATRAGVDAFAAFYGFPPEGAPLEKIAAPGLIFFGERESHFSIPDAKAFAEEQRKRKRECEVVVYPECHHAFFNDTRPQVFDREAANDAWRRTLDLFGKHLRG